MHFIQISISPVLFLVCQMANVFKLLVWLCTHCVSILYKL